MPKSLIAAQYTELLFQNNKSTLWPLLKKNAMKPKEAYHRFRDWQRRPSTPPQMELQEHQCPNCGHTYTGNYCPNCGQTAGDKRITWRMVGLNIMDVWGIGSSSLPHTLWHLLLRPGYFISDYLDGHRRSSYSPANMLFIVAIFYSLINHFVGWEQPIVLSSTDSELSLFYTAIKWLSVHPAWGMLTITTFLVLPTYSLFHFAPRRPGHSLPESATIQLFMSTLILIATLFNNLSHGWTFWLLPFYYLVTYHQIFNYNWWGTIWRIFLGFIIAFSLIVFIITVSVMVKNARKDPSLANIAGLSFVIIIFLALLIGLIALGYFISKHTSKHRQTPSTAPTEAAPAE